jgi:protein involved in polysaccharide export with SLBB domain
MKHPLLALAAAAALVAALLPACSSTPSAAELEKATCTVEGCVERPGTQALDGDRNLLEAVLAAGPIEGRSDLRHVRLVRPGRPSLELTVDVAVMLESGDSSCNVLLRPGDALHVPELP